MRCPKCGNEVPESSRFCGSCGSALLAACLVCGHGNPQAQRFCEHCGSEVASATPPGKKDFLQPLGYKWWIAALIVFVFGVVGVVLAKVNPSFLDFDWSHRAAPWVRREAWSQFIGIYLIEIALGMAVIHKVMFFLACHFTPEPLCLSPKNALAKGLVGICETVLYPAAWLVGLPAFIGIWLALKTAAGARLWQPDMVGFRFQLFLIGNALSIILTSLSFWIMRGTVLQGPSG